MINTYSTSDIAFFLGTQRQNINAYIRKGYLKAIMIDGSWEITNEDYISFREEYYDTDKRNSSRGVKKKLSHEQVSLLAFILSDLQNDAVSLKEFISRYKDKSELVPQMQDFIIYKRDMCIRYDYKERNIKQRQLANDYGLKLVTIQQIVSQNKDEIQL